MQDPIGVLLIPRAKKEAINCILWQNIPEKFVKMRQVHDITTYRSYKRPIMKRKPDTGIGHFHVDEHVKPSALVDIQRMCIQKFWVSLLEGTDKIWRPIFLEASGKG